ncbi:MAG: sodium:alanine symporter family protein [Solobacterium sp.]|nr:sodium:alanine symporter family protein [Solobacterium sp.]
MGIEKIIEEIDAFVWGPVTLMLLVGTGVYLTVATKFLPWRNVGYALKSVISKKARETKRGKGDISAFSSLMTASAATIGTGNIIGVATAMYAGGPGALVWMWVSALFGLTTKFSECMLAIKYRIVNEKGEMSGGPMYTMERGFKNQKLGKILAILFAVFTTFASFGIGNMTQANSISGVMNTAFALPEVYTGIVLTALIFIIVIGGIKSISRVSDVMVPVMAILYIIMGLLVIILNIKGLPAGLYQIFVMAVNPKAIGGGVLGAITVSVMNSIRYGVARGCFSNEAGLGSAAITAASATSEDAVEQGYIFMMDTFFDTIIICTITGLVIASSGVLGSLGADGLPLKGVALITAAFETVLGDIGKYVVSIGIGLFAFSTIIGWEYHGEKAVEYLFQGTRPVLIYRILYSLIVYIGCVQALDVIWNISDIMNALMAIPNLICLLVMSKEIIQEVNRFQKIIDQSK